MNQYNQNKKILSSYGLDKKIKLKLLKKLGVNKKVKINFF